MAIVIVATRLWLGRVLHSLSFSQCMDRVVPIGSFFVIENRMSFAYFKTVLFREMRPCCIVWRLHKFLCLGLTGQVRLSNRNWTPYPQPHHSGHQTITYYWNSSPNLSISNCHFCPRLRTLVRWFAIIHVVSHKFPIPSGTQHLSYFFSSIWPLS